MEQPRRSCCRTALLRRGRMVVLIALFMAATIAIASGAATNPFAGNADAVKAGEKLFDQNCTDCHGGDATGGSGPDLTDEKWIYGGTDGEVFASVANGRKGGMPRWSGELKDEDIWKVIAYVRSLAKKN